MLAGENVLDRIARIDPLRRRCLLDQSRGQIPTYVTSLLDEGTCGTSSPAASSSFEGTRRTRKAERPRKEAREESARIEGRGNERVRERERGAYSD